MKTIHFGTNVSHILGNISKLADKIRNILRKYEEKTFYIRTELYENLTSL